MLKGLRSHIAHHHSQDFAQLTPELDPQMLKHLQLYMAHQMMGKQVFVQLLPELGHQMLQDLQQELCVQ